MKALNALSGLAKGVLEFGAPEAYETGRERGLERRRENAFQLAGQSLQGGNYGEAANALFGVGDLENGITLQGIGEQRRQAQQQQLDDQQRQQMQQGLSFAQNAAQIPLEQRIDWIAQNWSLSGAPEPFEQHLNTYGPEAFSDQGLQEDMAQFRAALGEAPPEVESQEPQVINNQLIGPDGQVIGDYRDGPEQMSDYQRAQIALNRDELALNREKQAFSERQYEDEQFLEPEQFGVGGAIEPSPFDNLGQFGNGGEFMPVSFAGEDQFFDGGARRQSSDIGPQRDVPRPARAPGTVFDRKYDQEAGKRLAEWNAGGQARALGELEQLKGLIETLEGGENLSGPIVGALPRGVRRITNQRGVITQDAAEAIIQKTAKSVLGGQFTENEMAELLRRSYDPTLPETENARRMKGLYNQLVNEARNLDYMSRYAGQYGTTVGYEGQLPGIHDHDRQENHQLAPKEGEVQDGHIFLGGDPGDPNSWREVQ